MILVFTELQQANLFWRLDAVTLTLMPLPFILAPVFPKAFSLLLRTQLGESKFVNRPHSRQAMSGFAISMAVLIISCVAFFGFADPGHKKGGRILIDEGHSDWEWTTQPFDTTWYGERSTYNYYSMAQYLKYFYKVDQMSEELSEKLLSHYDILFIKTPTKPFTQTETDAIKEYVGNGGSLLLIGDHTNVFGITTNLNPIAEEFGMRFQYNAQYDLDGELSDYQKPKILPHPSVQWLPTFMFATGCTLDAPLVVENSIIGYGLKAIDADYSQANFFPRNAGNGENAQFGLFVQAAGIPFGKGRVFLLSDSTPWSNFYMFIPGKPELMLGILDWLNRRNTFMVLIRPVSLVVALLSFVALVLFALKIDREKVLLSRSLWVSF
ncbi:MAG: GldG family protein [Bacteroidetes bacterium]|nr:GldG family protein [Bacteroidota bacterium]